MFFTPILKTIKTLPTAIQNGIANGKNNSIVLSTDEAESQLTDFIEKVKVGGMSAEEYFNDPLNESKTVLKGYASSVDDASMSTKGFVQYSKDLNVQVNKLGKSGGIVSGVFRNIKTIITNGLVTLATYAIFSAIDYFENRVKRMKEEAEELKTAYENKADEINGNLNSVEGMSKEFDKLSRGVDNFGNNLSLTNDEYSRYKEISNELAEINPKLVQGYDDEGNAIINKNNAIKDTISLLKEQQKLNASGITSDKNLQKLASGLIGSFTDENVNMNGVHNIEDQFENNYSDELSKRIKTYVDNLDDKDKLKKEFATYWRTIAQSGFEYSANHLTDIQNDINELISKGGKDKDLMSDYSKYVNFINENIDQYNLYKQNLEEYTKSLNSTLQLIPSTLDFYDELSSGEKGIISSYINNFALDISDNHKSFEDQIVEERSKIISFCKTLNNSLDANGEPLSITLDALLNLDTTQSVQEYTKQRDKLLSKIADSDFAKNQGLSIDDIKVMLGFSFETNDNEIEDGLTNKIENIATRVVNRIPTLAGNQNGQAIIEGLLKNLTPDNIDTLMNTSLDKINSWQDVLNLLNTKTTFSLADYSEDVDNVQSKITALASAYKEIQDGTFEVGSSGWELVKSYGEFLPYLDDTNGGFEELGKKIKEAMGIAPNDLIKQLSQLKGLSDADQKSVNNLIKVLYKMKDVSLSNLTSDGLLTAEKNQVQAIIDKINDKKDKEQEYLDTLQEEEDTLNDIIDKYQTAGDTAIDYIEKEISSLEDSRDDVESYYDDLIDKLKEENDERDRAIELQEKQDAVANAKKKKVAIYSEASSWHLETNSDKVEKAQQELDSLQNEIAIDNLEKEKEAAMQPYTDQIEAFEKYKQAWSDAMSAYTNNQNEMIAQQILGIDWQGKLHNQDIGILNKYQTDYSGYQTKLKDNVQKEKEIIQNRIDQYAKEADEWEKYLKQFDTFVSDLSDQDVKYFEELKLKTLNEKSTYQERLDALREFKADYIQLSDDLAQYEGTSIKKALSGSGVYAVEKDNAILGAYTTKKEADKAMYKFAGQMISEKVSMLGGLSNISVTKLAELQKEIRSKFKVKQYATGGVNSYTGTAMLHGTPYKSEVIFNSSDAKKLYDIVHNTHNVASVVGKTIGDNLVSGTQAAGSMFTTNDTTNGDTTITFRIGEIHTTDGTTFLQQMNDYLKQADRDRMIGRNR
jgi:chromosome segregation ATPase